MASTNNDHGIGNHADFKGHQSNRTSVQLSHQSRRSSDSGRGWDVFETIIRGENEYDWAMYDKIIKLVKLVVLGATLLIVLITSVISRATFLLMVSMIGSHRATVCNLNTPALAPDRRYYLTLQPETSDSDKEAELIKNQTIIWTWCLFFCLIAPDLLTLLRSLRSVFSSASTWPSYKTFGTIALVETLRATGIGLLTFYILPSLNVIFGLMITSSICSIPVLLQLISLDDSNYKRKDLLLANIIASSIALLSLILWPIVIFYIHESITFGQLITLPIVLILISLGWSENYLPTESYLSHLISPLITIRESLASSRYLIYLFVGPLKITIYLAIMILVNQSVNQIPVHQLFTQFNLLTEPQQIVIKEDSDIGDSVLTTSNQVHVHLMIAQIIASLVCYILGKFACKICVQTSAFALPISLTSPLLISLATLICHTKSKFICLVYNYFYFLPGYVFWFCPNHLSLENWSFLLVLAFWFSTYVTSIWSSVHIWSPPRERTARTERLFVSPLYCSAFIDVSLAFNRRREKQQIISESDLTTLPTSTGGLGNFDSTELSDNLIHDSDRITRIYACVTMWHETYDEMLQTAKSLMKMDEDQSARANAQKYLKVVDPDYYQFETHIMFDDAFEIDDEAGEMGVNRYVKDFCEVVNAAVSAVHRTHLKLRPPSIIPTPYGGRLIWILPGETKLIVHLKDKAKIRHLKRWSQVMYMYYLLGYLLMDTSLHVNRKAIRAENTYLLTLDGDILFDPPAVLLLIDLMKKNGNLGAACGRIHPVGSGLMVWYQRFEYAVSHWLQKAAEHVFGCVLCSPGAFSLFRARSLMSPNVMATYASESKEPIDFVQHDQGEDRWLCTLLLQSGHRVEYNAASDAFTHCPESFNEFFIQRRRWGPSTIANIIDLLQDYRNIITINSSISIWYIGYQSFLMLSTIIGPGTILLMLIGAVNAVFKLDYVQSLLVNIIPVSIFIIVCFLAKNDFQLFLAQILSALYVFLMLAVLIGTAIQITEEPFSPSTLFFIILIATFLISAILHPREITCFLSFPLYMLCIPSMYLILQLYSLINLNVVTWGTREAPTKASKPTPETMAKVTQQTRSGGANAVLQFLSLMENRKAQESNISFSFGNLFRCMLCTHDTSASDNIQLVRVEEAIRELSTKVNSISFPTRARRASELSRVTEESVTNEIIQEVDDEEEKDSDQEPEEIKVERDDLKNPYWLEDPIFRNCPVVFLTDHEKTFWSELIAKYLYPLEKNAEREARVSAGLKQLRDKVMFGVLMLNAIFILTIFLLQLNKDKLSIRLPFRFDLASAKVKDDEFIDEVEDESTSELEPVGASFIICFALLLVIQTVGMFKHRLSTISHILAFVQLDFFKRKKANLSEDDDYIERNAIEIAKDLQCLRGIDEEDSHRPESGLKSESGNRPENSNEKADQRNDRKKSQVKKTKATLERKNTIFNLERKPKSKGKTLTLDVAFRKRFLSLSSQDVQGSSRLGGNLRRRQAIEALERRRDRLLTASTWWPDNPPIGSSSQPMAAAAASRSERSSSSAIPSVYMSNRSNYLENNYNHRSLNRFRDTGMTHPGNCPIDDSDNLITIPNHLHQLTNNAYSVITRSRLTNLRTFGYRNIVNDNNNHNNNVTIPNHNHNSGYQSSSESSVNNIINNNWPFHV